MLGSIPHQKFYFYHLPTRERVGIKLGDAWYVSNVSIIFDCSMLLYLLFWTILGFIFHFYITFGTNLLTEVPMPVSVFCAYFSVLQKRNTKRNPNGMKPSRELFLEQTQSRRLGVDVKKQPRRARGWRAPPLGAPPCLVGPSELHRRTSSSYLSLIIKHRLTPWVHRHNTLLPMNLRFQFINKKTFDPPPLRS